MQVRRWKYVFGQNHQKGHARATKEPNAETPQQDSPSETIISSKGVAVQFVNAAHPRDVNSAEAKKRIRSHAAKGVHASRRLRRQSHPADGGRLGLVHVPLPPPTDLLSASRKDPFQAFARRVTDTEQFLIDHCTSLIRKSQKRTLTLSVSTDVTVVIPNAGSSCKHSNSEPLYISGMKSHWIPLALSDAGLLCGLLLVACRSLVLSKSAVGDDYARMALAYKGECIKSTNQAVVAEGTSVSDATIAKVLVMASEEVRDWEIP